MLGGIFFTSLTLALLGLTGTTSEALAGAEAAAGWGNWARPQLGVYLACLAGFHLLEFWITAGWNPDRLSVDGKFAALFSSFFFFWSSSSLG
jgi:protein-S-isoprenylcysteine O-methyltransferase